MVEISVKEDVTLISFHDSPANMDMISLIFRRIAQAGIDVDMISQTPPNGQHSSLSFTVDDGDFGGILQISEELREINPDLKISVSSGNCKISVMDPEMNGLPGYAAKVFSAASKVHTDIRMITTSESDISLLVVKADLQSALQAIKSSLHTGIRELQ